MSLVDRCVVQVLNNKNGIHDKSLSIKQYCRNFYKDLNTIKCDCCDYYTLQIYNSIITVSYYIDQLQDITDSIQHSVKLCNICRDQFETINRYIPLIHTVCYNRPRSYSDSKMYQYITRGYKYNNIKGTKRNRLCRSCDVSCDDDDINTFKYHDDDFIDMMNKLGINVRNYIFFISINDITST